jgi:hypothetical protein
MDTPPVIAVPDQITAAWLTSVLRRQPDYSSAEVLDFTMQVSYPHGQSSAHTIMCALRPRLTDGRDLRLMVKLASPALATGIPDLGKREVHFYQHAAPYFDKLPIVRCYDAVFDDDQQRLHVVMDDLTETHIALPPMQLPPPDEDCERMLDALAQLHAAWWDQPSLGKLTTFPTAEALERAAQDNIDAYARFAEFLGTRLPAARRALYEAASVGLPARLAERLLPRQGLTIVFEDVHAGNFLYPRDASQHSIKLIDWEQWHINFGAHDLAYMMGLFWFSERRARLERPFLRRYLNALIASGVQDYTWDDLLADYRLGLLAQLFQPVWMWSHGGHPDVWWHHLERITTACFEWECDKLL